MEDITKNINTSNGPDSTACLNPELNSNSINIVEVLHVINVINKSI